LDLRKLNNSICQFFVICHGTSNTHVSSIAQSVEKEMKEAIGEYAYRKEGYSNSEWVLLDFSNVVVHVFQEHIRHFYNIEELWADAQTTEIPEA
jgi:ribosome-associated protein